MHFGSLVAAVGSCLHARSRGGEWLIRVEDIDPPREVSGAADSILHTLERLGFEWDGEVWYQSARNDAYAAALARLQDMGHVYPCACSRREIADSGLEGFEGPVYPGTCRDGLPPGREGRAWRVRTTTEVTGVDDLRLGRMEQVLERDIGDYPVKRADGYWAYQLAVVVDDAAQGITEIVRGADLAASTPRQVWLQRLLGMPTPEYLHLPVVLDEDGRKLSKTSNACPLDAGHEAEALCKALDFLAQDPPQTLRTAPVPDIWSWALENWSAARIGAG